MRLVTEKINESFPVERNKICKHLIEDIHKTIFFFFLVFADIRNPLKSPSSYCKVVLGSEHVEPCVEGFHIFPPRVIWDLTLNNLEEGLRS